MKKDVLGTLVFFDFFLGCLGVMTGTFYTFISLPWIGWGLIISGVLLLCILYFLLWGVEEILKEEKDGK